MTTTWNPSDKGADIVLSNNNLTASGSGGVNNTVRATTSNSGGKWYFEFALNDPGSNSNSCIIGFATGNANILSTNLSGVADTAGLAFEGGTAVGTYVGSGFTIANAISQTWATNDVCQIAIDFGAGYIWFGRNGTWLTGDPALGTSPALTFSGLSLFPAFTGSSTTIGWGTVAFAPTSFYYSMPAGFAAWQAGSILPLVEFGWFNFSEHPGPIPRVSPDDTIKNNQGYAILNLLLPKTSPISFQSNVLTIDPKHPPRSWTLPEFLFPNMVLDDTELEFPNLLIPYDFNRHPPVSWRAPEFIFPQNAQALSVFLFTTPEVMAMRQQIFQQRNPPRSFQFPLPIFPNITLAESKIVTVPFQLWPMDFYRHPPPYYRSVEFMPVNFLAKNIPGIPVTLPATFIRNIQPELDQVRQASPTLTEIRQPGYTLQAIRNFLTKLSK